MEEHSALRGRRTMSIKRLTTTLSILVFAFTAHASGQKNELAGLIGRTFVSDQGIQGSSGSDNNLRFGNGLSFEVNYARRVMTRDFLSVSLEVPIVLNPDEDLHASLPNRVPQQYASYFVTPAARINVFSGQAISPWVSVGGGIGHFAESSTLLFGGKNTGKTGTNTGIFQVGAGLDVKILGNISLRGEVRDFWSGVPQLDVNTGKSRQHNYLVAAGVVWHF
jgi:opacity protein-like surface antigen